MATARARTLSLGELDRIIEAAKEGRTLFGRGSRGEIAWMLTGADRMVLYRLIAEVGMLPQELTGLMATDVQRDDGLPLVKLNARTAKARQGLLLPVPGALAAALSELLRDREPDATIFNVASVANLESAFAFDVEQAGLAHCFALDALATFFQARLRPAGITMWSDAAAEVCE